MDKKTRERRILQFVYDLEKFAEIKEGECPDFTLRRSKSSGLFGVEVTELYDSEPSARLENIPGYSESLLSGGRHRHRDDIQSLQVAEVRIEGADDVPSTVTQAIIYELPKPSEYLSAVRASLETKEGKIAKYDPGLTHVNLIVHDRSAGLALMDLEGFYKFFFTAEVRRLLGGTRFREVCLVTQLKELGAIYFPLRMILLLSELYLFFDALPEYEGTIEADESIELDTDYQTFELFARALRLRGFDATVIDDPREPHQVVLGNTGILIKSQRVVLRDYADRAIPGNRMPMELGLAEGAEAALAEFISRHSTTRVFTSGLFMKVREASNRTPEPEPPA